jgi:hypothetical protein
VNPSNPDAERTMRDVREAARVKGVQLLILNAGAENEIDAAFAYFVQLHASALLVGHDPFFFSRGKRSPVAEIVDWPRGSIYTQCLMLLPFRPQSSWTDPPAVCVQACASR